MNENCGKKLENQEPAKREPPPDLSAWFSVSGDMDDFIFYDAADRVVSEK